MKKLLISMIVVFCLLISSCGISTITTSIGINIGETFQKNAERGAIGAEGAIKAWPYISGMIKRAGKHGLEMSKNVEETIRNLDKLAKKDFNDISLEEKGDIILSICIVEQAAIQMGWSQYGVSLMQMFSKAIGG